MRVGVMVMRGCSKQCSLLRLNYDLTKMAHRQIDAKIRSSVMNGIGGDRLFYIYMGQCPIIRLICSIIF